MAVIEQGNTIFNVSSDAVFSKNGKYSHGSNVDGSKFDADYFAENPDDLSKSFNAIEIDWNGAQTNIPGYETINTTGQFISLLNNLIERTTILEKY